MDTNRLNIPADRLDEAPMTGGVELGTTVRDGAAELRRTTGATGFDIAQLDAAGDREGADLGCGTCGCSAWHAVLEFGNADEIAAVENYPGDAPAIAARLLELDDTERMALFAP